MKYLSSSILTVPPVRPRPLEPGSLLLAEPLLTETYFNHGVITLVDYTTDDGALGLVMNIPTNHTLDEYLDGVDRFSAVPVYCGGPLGQDRMVFMHTLGSEFFEGSKQFAPGLYLGGDFDAAIDYVNSGYPTEGVLRFFVGYSGWDSPQLKDEIDDNVWAICESPADRSLLLKDDLDAYWHRFVRRMGEPYRPWQFYPRNLQAN